MQIFGRTVTYPCMRTLLSVKLEKPKKIALLLEALEEGDELKLVFVPGDESGIGEYVDRIVTKGEIIECVAASLS